MRMQLHTQTGCASQLQHTQQHPYAVDKAAGSFYPPELQKFELLTEVSAGERNSPGCGPPVITMTKL
jgi:hypothetical protein